MKNNTVGLVQLLSDKESEAFRQHLATLKRDKTLKLFEAIRQQPYSEYEKVAVFESVFSMSYTNEKDYLLRNEFRLLLSELKKFVAFEEMKALAEKNPLFQHSFYIDWLLQKNEWETAEKESLKLIDNAIEEGDYYTASEAQKRYIDRYVDQKEITSSNYHYLLKNIAKFYEATTKNYRYRMADIQIKQAYVECALSSINPEYTPQNSRSNIFDDEQDIYLMFARLLIEAYTQQGQPKIDTLSKAVYICDKITKKGFNKSSAKSSLFASIALEYFLSGEYSKSIPFHEQALQEIGGSSPQEIISYVFNYASTLIRIEYYEEAIRVIDENESVWNKIPRVKDRFLCLKAMSCIFLGKPEEAWNCIPHNRKRSGIDHYYYYRFIQIIVYLIRKEYSLAQSEMETYIHTIRNNDNDATYLQLCILLKNYIVLLTEKNVLTKKTFKSKSKTILDLLLKKQHKIETSNHALLYRWVVRFINQ